MLSKTLPELFQFTEMTILAFFLFFVTFLGILFWIFRRSGKMSYLTLSRLPLQEEGVNHERS